MAKLISELGADVFDDTIVVKKTLLSKKQRNWIIGGIVSGVLAAGLITVYILAGTTWLLDYENMQYIQYAYSATPNEDGEITAKIDRVLSKSNYPTDFRVPAYINGIRITEIGDEAFAGCTRLKKIRMTDNITKIGDEAFAGCTSLEEIQFSKNITHIGNQAFLLTKYYDELPSDEVTLVNEVLIHVGDDFLGNKAVLVSNPSKDIDGIRDYLQNGYKVFNFDTLENITLENINQDYEVKYTITQWMDGLFEDRDSIEVVEAPVTLDFIPNKAFLGCQNLKKVVIHDGIKEILDSAFESCTSLVEFNIPDNVEIIGDYAFKNTAVSIDYLPNTVKTLGEGVLENCSNIQSFTFPSSINNIPIATFKGCSSLETFNFADQKVITAIGYNAFEGTALKTFKVPENVNSLSDGVFKNCTELEYVELFNNVDGQFIPGTEYVDTFTHQVAGTIAGVNRINAEAFKGCTSFRGIYLYDSLGQRDPNCIDSDTIYFPVTLERTGTSQLGDATHETFVGTKVKHVIFPEVIVNIGANMFEDVTTLEDVTFTNYSNSHLVSIGRNAFDGCIGLTKLIVPNSCGKIEAGAFKDCSNLVEVHLPDHSLLSNTLQEQYSAFTSINHELFENCSSLLRVNIPDGVTQIADKAFKGCVSLQELYIPASVTSINDDAFDGCTKLTVTTGVDANKIPRKWEDGWDKDIIEVIYGQERP